MDRIKRASSERGGDAGELTPFGHGSYEIALLAAGGCMTAVEAVLDGKVDNAYALVRPPGHHAEKDQGRGFCIFANTALAAAHARQARGCRAWRSWIGTCTTATAPNTPFTTTRLCSRSRSTRTTTTRPARGPSRIPARGRARATTSTSRSRPGRGVGAYVATFERVVAPALRAFRPELILVASGLDASAMDPLASMMMTSDGYRKLTQVLLDVARDVCGGRLVACHEGGYSPAYVPYCRTCHPRRDGRRSDRARGSLSLTCWQRSAARSSSRIRTWSSRKRRSLRPLSVCRRPRPEGDRLGQVRNQLPR